MSNIEQDGADFTEAMNCNNIKIFYHIFWKKYRQKPNFVVVYKKQIRGVIVYRLPD